MEDERKSSEGTGITPRAKLLMALVAVITILAVWLLPSDKKEPPSDLPELAVPPEADQADPLPPSSADEDVSKAVFRAGDRAREIIARLRAVNAEPDPDEVFGHAEQLQRESQFDDAYLLYRFAARKGHAQAALVLGSQADSDFYTPETSILPMPDPEQAYKWYRVAAAAGNEEAERRLQSLRERVEQSAADGNESARRLMLQWR